MDIEYYRTKAIKKMEGYLQETVSAKEASDWALDVIRSNDWETLPGSISHAIHLLFDLHDEGEPWCPGRDELEKCKANLQKGDI